MPANPHLILSVGTRVVALVEIRGPDGKAIHPRGALGIVTQAPSDYWHTYRVRFPDGYDVGLKRSEISIFSEYKQEMIGGSANPLHEYNLYDRVIYRCIIGSRAYGLDDEQSDTDRRGIYLPPADLHWSLWGVPEQLENLQTEETYWELQKFLTLALKANPNVLECLYSPEVEFAGPIAIELLAMREKFLSKMVYQTYNGYVMSQFKKLQADIRNRGEIKWKHVMHLIRLLLAGIGAMENGIVTVRISENRDQLLAIKRGEMPFAEIEQWRLDLHKRFDASVASSKLPEKPDYLAANELLIKARRSAMS